MAKKNTDPFAHIRTEMLEVAPICKSCDNFKRGVNISQLSKQTGVAPVSLSEYLRGNKELGRVGLTRLINFLETRKAAQTDEAAEQAAAVAEAQSL